MEKEQPSYYAVIPSNVRYDKELRPNAKLLYAEISALCNAGRPCTARNAYFANLYGLSRKTVSELISKLAEKSYIKVKILRDGRAQVTGREITILEAPGTIPRERAAYPENAGDPPRKIGPPVPKNREDIIGGTLQDKTNTPIIPKGMDDVWNDYAGDDGELLQALRDFEKMRKQKKKPMTVRAKKILLTTLEKHAGGSRACKLRMLEESVLHCWDSVYPPREEGSGRGADGNKGYSQGYSQESKLEEW